MLILDNKDDMDAAINGLAQFCHSFCMNCAETQKQGNLVFRCRECAFGLDDDYCAVKKFLNKHATPEQRDKATAMGAMRRTGGAKC